MQQLSNTAPKLMCRVCWPVLLSFAVEYVTGVVS